MYDIFSFFFLNKSVFYNITNTNGGPKFQYTIILNIYSVYHVYMIQNGILSSLIWYEMEYAVVQI